MTINELIEKLKSFPQDTKVVRIGHDGGMEDIYDVDIQEINNNFKEETIEEVVLN